MEGLLVREMALGHIICTTGNPLLTCTACEILLDELLK